MHYTSYTSSQLLSVNSLSQLVNKCGHYYLSIYNQVVQCPVLVCLALHEEINISRQEKTTNEIRFKYNPHNYLHELYIVTCPHSKVISV